MHLFTVNKYMPTSFLYFFMTAFSNFFLPMKIFFFCFFFFVYPAISFFFFLFTLFLYLFLFSLVSFHFPFYLFCSFFDASFQLALYIFFSFIFLSLFFLFLFIIYIFFCIFFFVSSRTHPTNLVVRELNCQPRQCISWIINTTLVHDTILVTHQTRLPPLQLRTRLVAVEYELECSVISTDNKFSFA